LFLYIVLAAFSLWMLIDAIRRKAEWWWLAVIVLSGPVGALVYFVVKKAKDLRFGDDQVVPLTLGGDALPHLKELAQESPSIANRLAYGDALRQSGMCAEAVVEYQHVLKRDGKCKEALHGVALCHIELGAHAEAAEQLSQLMDLDPRYQDYRAATDYAEALWLDGQRERGLEIFEDVAMASGRLEHSLTYANYLAIAEDKPRARSVLESALREFAQSPGFVRRRDHGLARDAERLLAQLG